MTSLTSSARTRLAVLLATVVAVLAPLATVGAASAAPTTPNFTSTIDAYPRWVSETGCLTGVRPGVTYVIEKLLKPTYGGTSWDFLGQRACSAGKESAHDDGKALDWMMSVRNSTEKAKANDFIGWLLATDKYGNKHANARRLGIMYFIWDNRMFRLYNASAGWQPYGVYVGGVRQHCVNVPSSTYDTTCHRDHVHISFTPDGAYQRTSWWTGARVTAPTTSPTPTTSPAPTTATTRTLRITSPLALTTRSGATVTATGTAVRAGDRVQTYVRPSGSTSWIPILSPVTANTTGVWTAKYTTSRTHDLQVRVGTAVSNTVRVTVS